MGGGIIPPGRADGAAPAERALDVLLTVGDVGAWPGAPAVAGARDGPVLPEAAADLAGPVAAAPAPAVPRLGGNAVGPGVDMPGDEPATAEPLAGGVAPEAAPVEVVVPPGRVVTLVAGVVVVVVDARGLVVPAADGRGVDVVEPVVGEGVVVVPVRGGVDVVVPGRGEVVVTGGLVAVVPPDPVVGRAVVVPVEGWTPDLTGPVTPGAGAPMTEVAGRGPVVTGEAAPPAAPPAVPPTTPVPAPGAAGKRPGVVLPPGCAEEPVAGDEVLLVAPLATGTRAPTTVAPPDPVPLPAAPADPVDVLDDC